jgi:hypothetical protein
MIRYSKLFAVFCAIFFLLFSCEKSNKLSPTQQEKLIQIGESSAMALMKDLKKHLLEALAEDDLVGGFEFCAAQAIALTENVQDSLPAGITVKRTSTKHRNPQNAPDGLETEALEYFAKEYSKTEKLPQYHIQQSSPTTWHYYKPMKIGKLCLKCHGTPNLIEDSVLLSLKENYPDDIATGYKLNEFRGVVRVGIPVKLLSE